MPLEKELETWNAHKAELLARASGQYALIKGEEVVDTFFSEEDALKEGYRRFGQDAFLVKEIVEMEVPLNFVSGHLAL